MTHTTIEIIGLCASGILIISFLMKNLTRLRIINTIGCLLFILYGILLATSWPIIITNAFIIVVNLCYLLPSYYPKKEFLKAYNKIRQGLFDKNLVQKSFWRSSPNSQKK